MGVPVRRQKRFASDSSSENTFERDVDVATISDGLNTPNQHKNQELPASTN